MLFVNNFRIYYRTIGVNIDVIESLVSQLNLVHKTDKFITFTSMISRQHNNFGIVPNSHKKLVCIHIDISLKSYIYIYIYIYTAHINEIIKCINYKLYLFLRDHN